MKLSIIVPHYEEPLEVCTPLMDSIALQQGVDLKDIEVIVVQDGGNGIKVANSLLGKNYPFVLSVLPNKHQGVSAARNLGLEMATGDYVMFCDCDDMFLNNYGLHLLFSAMSEEPDAITSCFVEEQVDNEGNYKIIRHDKDVTFVHGKAYKRAFLNEQYIRFDDNLTIHEDGYFNTIAITCAEGNVKVIETPFYLWKWNENSTVRKNPTDFVLKTYGHIMSCRIAICKELETRGYINEFIDAVVKTVMDSYYDFNKPSFLAKENAEYRKVAELAFKEFFMKFKREFFDCAVARKAEIAFVSRSNAYVHGLVIETVSLADWLKHIQEL